VGKTVRPGSPPTTVEVAQALSRSEPPTIMAEWVRDFKVIEASVPLGVKIFTARRSYIHNGYRTAGKARRYSAISLARQAVQSV
jgi:hypothetical protein